MNKYLSSGLAILAALVIAGPVWAQPNPSAGNGMGLPGPNPGGGGGLTPYSGGAPPPSSATPPAYHHMVRHGHAMYRHHRHMAYKAALSGDTTSQLNREELARIQSGNYSNPPSPPGPAPMGGGGGYMGGPGAPPPPGQMNPQLPGPAAH